MTTTALAATAFGGGLAFVWALMGVAFWIALIVLIVLLVRGTSTTARACPEPAVRLLETRYARGEITREEFLERRATLSGRSPTAPGDDAR
jgi:uncharacterized membrane protein